MSVAKARVDLDRLRGKAAALQQALRDVEEQAVKLAHYIEVASAYEHESVSWVSDEATNGAARIRTPHQSASMPKNVKAVIEILERAAKPLPTRVLVEKLAEQGIVIGGKLPVTGLSSALSRHKELLTASRSEGWSLNKWANDQRDPDLMRDDVVTRDADEDVPP